MAYDRFEAAIDKMLNVVDVDQLNPQQQSEPLKRASRKRDPGLLALGRFSRALNRMDERERLASIRWLNDRYLGIKMR